MAPTYLQLVADEIAQNPLLIQNALEVVAHWRQLQAQPEKWLDMWQKILEDALQNQQGKQHLQEILRGEGEQNQRLREFAPMAGLLPREVRMRARDLCGYRH